MDAVLLARFQFAMTVGFHYIFPLLTIGLAWLIVIFESLYLRNNDLVYKKLSKFWIKIFGITFAMGVATGITMEFQFGMNWAAYSRFVGDIFGAPLAAEAIFSFFLESSFLGLLLYGEKRLSKKMYLFSALMVAVGASLSGLWIVAANSWQQTPDGFILANGRAELVNFWAATFNPSTIVRYIHVIAGSFVCSSFFVAAISAYYLLKKEHIEFAKKAMFISLIVAFSSSFIVAGIGDIHAKQVAKYQPAKLAAFEGHWETSTRVPFIVFGIPDEEKEVTNYAIKIPYLLSLLAFGDIDSKVVGLKDFPKDERPPVKLSFFSFHTMLALGTYFLIITALGLWLYRKNRLFENRTYLKILMFSVPLPIVANEVGWMAAEVGRQPWIVYNILKTKDAVSISVSANEILFSILTFATLYAVLFVAWLYLLKRKIHAGP